MQEPFSSHPNPLLPTPTFTLGFTTNPHLAATHPPLTHVPLTDSSLGVHKVSSRTTHTLVSPPPPHHHHPAHDGLPPPETAWEAVYPKGSVNPKAEVPGGFGFYLTGPGEFRRGLEEGAREVGFGYRVMLQEGWEWVKGGKLPGVFGGIGDLAYSCTGGRQDHRCQCFDLRPMWRFVINHPFSPVITSLYTPTTHRSKGVGELYTYLPLTEPNAKALLATPPESIANSDYGFSVGRGSFDLDIAVGRWVAIAFRVKLNDPGKYNGRVQVWVDGVSAMTLENVCICEPEDGRIKGMHFQTFFGGHSQDWASPKDQRAWFADITGVIIG